LTLRQPRLSDAPALLGFLGDGAAMRYTLTLPDLRDCRRHLAGHECQRRKVGYGPWTVLERDSEEIIGFGGLYDDPVDAGWGTEVSYRFKPSAWGKGYASELTAFSLAFARDVLRLGEVLAFAHPDNKASRRVLEKSGFREKGYVAPMNRCLFSRQLTDGERR
jgi:RimJ/RimL family protein N-acetyltransferase